MTEPVAVTGRTARKARRAKGSTPRARRPIGRRFALLVAAVCASLAFGAVPALANVGHNYLCQITATSPGSASECHSGGSAAPGGFSNPRGLTISNGNLWVTSPGTPAADKFNSTGGFLSQIPGSGSGYSFAGLTDGVAVNNSTGTTYLADSGPVVVDVFDGSGGFLSRWNGSTTASGSFGSGYDSIAVDNSTDASAGDVYVTDSTHEVIDKLSGGTTASSQPTPVNFSGSASYISGSQITGTPTGRFSFNSNSSDAITVDSQGNIYVADNGNHVVDEFASSGLFVQSFIGTATPTGSFGSIYAVAVDSSGNVYVSDQSNDAVDEFSSDGTFIGQLTGAATPAASFATPTGLAVDASGDVYVSDTNHEVVDKFGPAVQLATPTTSAASSVTTDSATVNGSVDPAGGGDVTSCEFDYGTGAALVQTAPCSPATPYTAVTAVSADLTGLNPDTTYFFRVSATDAQGTAVSSTSTFTTSGPATIASESNSVPTATGATLQAQINPHGFDTTYHFEYGTTTSYGNSIPIPDADIGAGASNVSVSQAITELTPATTYHFRVVATSSEGTVNGADRTFTTAPPASITSVSANSITNTGATLNAQINPEGFDTTYHFEYGTTTSYGTDVPVPDADIGSGTSNVSVSQAITGLTQGTLYHYRVVATNSLGTADSPDLTFTSTPAVAVSAQTATNVTDTTATLKAQLNPEGADTKYQFQYGTSSSYSQTVPANPVDIGSGTTNVAASVDLTGLQPNTTYHFRVTASNSAGTDTGADATFKTFPSSLPTGLPDNRAYEQVTPVNKDNGEFYARAGEGYSTYASANGNAFAYFSFNGLPGSQFDGSYYLANRGSGGWTSQNTIPPQSTEGGLLCATEGAAMVGYSSDLATGVLSDGTGSCGHDDPPLVAGEPTGAANLFVRDNATGTYRLVNVTPAAVTPAAATFDGASSNLGTVVFSESAPLVSGAPSGADLYDWSGGTVHLVTYLPDGTPTTGTLAGGTLSDVFHAVSNDGSRIFFTAGGNLYVRENNSTTVQVDAPATGGAGPGGGGQFRAATPDGSVVYFTDNATAGLTSDTVAGSGVNLYAYNTESHTLTDLTPNAAATVQGLSGMSGDGSYVYFVADGSLASGATAGQPNLYQLHGTTLTFVATLSNGDLSDWSNSNLTSRVSDNGQYIAFNSLNNLTSSQNGGHDEIFVWSASTGVQCASCMPTGVTPTAGAKIASPVAGALGTQPAALQRYVSDSGQVFFATADPLLPAATNGVANVYEYENGNVHLISSGQSPDASIFLDASADGSNVFFATSEQLLPQDTDGAYDVYDARVGGGFPSSPPAQPCDGDSCKPPAGTGSPAPVVGTVTFFGPGNPTPTTPKSPKTTKKPKVKVSAKTLKGFRFSIDVKVPAKGKLTVSGTGLKTLHKAVKGGHTYKITMRLTAKERKALARKHKTRMRLKVHILYRPTTGKSSSATVPVTVKA